LASGTIDVSTGWLFELVEKWIHANAFSTTMSASRPGKEVKTNNSNSTTSEREQKEQKIESQMEETDPKETIASLRMQLLPPATLFNRNTKLALLGSGRNGPQAFV